MEKRECKLCERVKPNFCKRHRPKITKKVDRVYTESEVQSLIQEKVEERTVSIIEAIESIKGLDGIEVYRDAVAFSLKCEYLKSQGKDDE
jgi:hypothetical protein